VQRLNGYTRDCGTCDILASEVIMRKSCGRPSDPFYTLRRGDIGKARICAFGKWWPTEDFIGRVLTKDVGKRVYKRRGILQVENDAQRARRLRR
jgi:hypothetical protein